MCIGSIEKGSNAKAIIGKPDKKCCLNECCSVFRSLQKVNIKLFTSIDNVHVCKKIDLLYVYTSKRRCYKSPNYYRSYHILYYVQEIINYKLLYLRELLIAAYTQLRITCFLCVWCHMHIIYRIVSYYGSNHGYA